MHPAEESRHHRTILLFGEDGFACLRAAGVVVAGLGGVGAHAAVGLARSGIGRLLLIDCDEVSSSSLNRHPVAGPTDVGRSKVEVLIASLADSCPDTQVEGLDGRLDADTLADMLPSDQILSYRSVIDAIDSVPGKVALLAHAVGQGRRTVCSLGAGGKTDPGAVRTGTLAESRVCPLGRVVRRGVRSRGIDPGRILAVWSEEEPRPPAPADPDPAAVDRFGRRRRQPSGMMLPGMFGFALAALVLREIATGE